eukprot:g3073.t1
MPEPTTKRRQAASLILGPSQRQRLSDKDPGTRSLAQLLSLMLAFWAATAALLLLIWEVPVRALPQLWYAVATLERQPFAASDNAAALVAIAITLPLLAATDFLFRTVCSGAGARWFLLHAFGNAFIVFFALPDMGYTFERPSHAMSGQYCTELVRDGRFAACSDWPQCIIVALHAYHMLAFQLSAEDVFHHIVFVPLIAGANFGFQFGTCANILAFFISGLPGGVDYAMLGLVKMGYLDPMREKRLNCSINTWVRAPGINAFCIVAISAFSNPPAGGEADRVPGYFFWPLVALTFFNGQYYAQRVVGNYYIRETQRLAKSGIKHVDLHAS